MTNPTKYFLLLLTVSCFHFPLPAQQNVPAQAGVDSLQNILLTAKEDTNKVNTLNNLAWEFRNTDEYENSVNCAKEAFILSDNINYKKGKAKSLNIIGVVYMDQGNYSEALKNHYASLKIREEIGDKRGMANSYNNIGIIYDDQGNYPEALKNH